MGPADADLLIVQTAISIALVADSAEPSVYPHLSMFALHLPMRDLNLFRLRQVIHGCLEPAGSDSVGLICMWLSYPDSLNLSSHSFKRSVATLLSNGGTVARKLLRDSRRCGITAWPKRGCLSSSICLRRSFLLETALLTSGGAMPERM